MDGWFSSIFKCKVWADGGDGGDGCGGVQGIFCFNGTRNVTHTVVQP